MSEENKSIFSDLQRSILDVIEENDCYVKLPAIGLEINTKTRKFYSPPEGASYQGLELEVEAGVCNHPDNIYGYIRIEDDTTINKNLYNESIKYDDTICGTESIIIGEKAILAYANALEYIAGKLRSAVSDLH